MTIEKGNRWITLAIVLIGFFMILVDTTIVNVSIPTIIADLHANLTDIEWIISGYALSFAALLISFGRLGDLYGRRLLFMAGLLTFTISSLFSGEAHSTTTLIVARLFQGVGGAMLSPATLSIISSTFRGRERATAFGMFGAVSGIAVAVGPLVGGWLTTYYSWRWIFRVNIPIGILGLILSWRILQESRADQGKPVDLAGMITSSIGFFLLVFGLIEGQNYGWWKPTKAFILGHLNWGTDRPFSIVTLAFIICAVFLIAFLIIQAVKTKNDTSPAVDLRFFHSRAYRYGLIALAIIALGEFSSLFTLPIFLQTIHGFTPLESGYGVLPLALAALVAAPSSAVLINRIGSKWVITTGISLEALGLLLLGQLRADSSYLELVPGLILLGIGIGLAVAQNTQVTLSEINPHESGSASGVLNTVRQVGTALGIAIIGAVLTHQASLQIPQQITQASLPGVSAATKDKIAQQIASSNTSYTGQESSTILLPTPPPAVQSNPVVLKQYEDQVNQVKSRIHTAVNIGLANSIAFSIRTGSVFMLAGALLSLLIPNIPAHKKEDPV